MTVFSDSSLAATLKTPGFRRLWTALIVFNLGHWVQVVTSAWLVLELTQSPLWVGLMIGAPTLPLLVLSLPAGAAADLLDRQKVLVGSSFVLVAANLGMVGLWIAEVVTPMRLISLGLMLGIGVTFFNPAWQAMVPALVPTSLVPGAVSLNSTTGGIATAVGPALGGFLVATAGPGWSFAVAAAGYVVMLLAVANAKPAELEQDRAPMGTAIATGVRYLRFSPGYPALLLLGSLFGLTSAALRAMLPNLTSDILGGGSTGYGLLLGVFGAGAIVGGLTRNQGAGGLGRHMIPASIIGFGLATGMVGLSTSFIVTGIAVLLAGLLWSWILATLITTFQLLSPDWVRGRAMGAFVLSVFGMIPIGSVLAGHLAEVAGVATSILIFAVGVVTTGILAFRLGLPVLEHIEPPSVPTSSANISDDGLDPPGPVLISTYRAIDQSDISAFLGILSGLRRVRLSTGASDWSVYRSVTDPGIFVETYVLPSWDQFEQQKRRLATSQLETLRKAERFGLGSTRVEYLARFDIGQDP